MPTTIASAFGSSSLLSATLQRLCAANLARVVVAHRESEANREVAKLCAGLDVELHVGPPPATPIDLALAVFDRFSLARVLLVDPRAAFVSPTILSALLSTHVASGKELALCPPVPRGLSGIAATRGALARLQPMYVAERFIDPEIDLFAFIDKIRSAFDVADLSPAERFMCVPARLVPATDEELALHAPYRLDPRSEEYEPLFAELSARDWARFDSLAPRRKSTARRPKIVFANYCTNREQGTTLSFEVVLQHWDREGWDGVLCLPGLGPLHERYAVEWPIRTVAVRPFSALADPMEREGWTDEIDACLRFLDEERPDVVYVAGSITQLAMACRLRGIPALAHMHLPLTSLSPRMSGAGLRAVRLPLYDLVVAPSEWFERNLRAVFRPPSGRLTAVQCGIDLERFSLARVPQAAARRRLGLPDDAKIVAAIGTITGLKRPEVAIEMLPHLVAREPTCLLVFAGAERGLQPGYRSVLEAQAQRLGVGQHVKFVGFVPESEVVHAASDLLLHCGLAETFGMVLAEAMAMERPVVAFASRGPIEIVDDGVTGRLLSPRCDPAEVARTIADIFDDPALARRMGQAGAERARARFGEKLFVQRIAHLCQCLVTGRSIEDAGLGIRG